jgi:hypothetical protein
MASIKSIRRLGAASLVVPSLDHLIAPTLTMIFAPAIMDTMFGSGAVATTIFFVVLGTFQLIWIVVLLKSSNSTLLSVGILGNLVSIFIYLLSASGVTIFGVPPQPFSAFPLVVKALETAFILASVYVLRTKASLN